MRQYFDSLQVFIAAALSLVVFIGILWVEQSNFVRVSKLSDPFDQAQWVNERVVVNGEDPKSWLHQTGELFLLLPGAKFNLLNQTRELEEGILFINTNFQDEALIQKAKKAFSPPFRLEGAVLDGGQIRVGPAVLGIPQGIAVLRRDLVRQETEIYAYDHPVDLYLPGAESSFLVPPGYKVLLKENRAELLGALYYTKLKKELKLQTITPESVGFDNWNAALLDGLEQSNLWKEQIITYAQAVVTSGDRFAPNSIMGKLSAGLGHIQRYYGLGINKLYKAEYRYQQLLKNLKQAYFALDGKSQSAVEISTKAFLDQKQSADWARFFVEHPRYNKFWADFARLQRVWFYYIFPEDFEVEALKPLWGPSMIINTVPDLADNYYLFEKYYTQSYRNQAQNQLDFILENIANVVEFDQTHQRELTRLRRQLAYLLQSEPNFRNENNFTLYTALIEKEQQFLEKSSESAQEIRLEVAQELLFFLKDLLDSSSRQDMAIILLRSYRNLQVSSLAENLGRSVFSAQERETLGKIQGLGTLSEEKLAAIRESNRAAADALALFDSLNSQNTTVEIFQPVGIQSEADFLDLLMNLEVQTQGTAISQQDQGNTKIITFSQALYQGYSLQGTFNTGNQSFSFLKLGNITESRATASNLSAFLGQMVSKNQEQETEKNPVVEETGPNNYNSTAKIQRRNILELLNQSGINVSLDNVLLTNEALTQARVQQASFQQQYLLSFDFDLGPPMRVRNVTADYGRSTILLPGQIFKVETLSQDLKSSIEAKLRDSIKTEE